MEKSTRTALNSPKCWILLILVVIGLISVVTNLQPLINHADLLEQESKIKTQAKIEIDIDIVAPKLDNDISGSLTTNHNDIDPIIDPIVDPVIDSNIDSNTDSNIIDLNINGNANNSLKTVFITNICNFISFQIALTLGSMNISVIGIDNFRIINKNDSIVSKFKRMEYIQSKYPELIKIISGDLCDKLLMKHIFTIHNFSHILHLTDFTSDQNESNCFFNFLDLTNKTNIKNVPIIYNDDIYKPNINFHLKLFEIRYVYFFCACVDWIRI